LFRIEHTFLAMLVIGCKDHKELNPLLFEYEHFLVFLALVSISIATAASIAVDFVMVL